jgi:transposase-like protein
MNCPDCGTRMESEYSPEFNGDGWRPSSIYRCDECDSEWVWRSGERMTKLDGARV